MKYIHEFVQVYRLYRTHHPIRYAIRRAFDMAFRSIPF